MEEIGGVVLIVIDSMLEAVVGDFNRNSDVRQALGPLMELGEKQHCAILGITHVNKNSTGKAALAHVAGNLACGAMAHIVLFSTKVQSSVTDGSHGRCLLVRAKSNIGPNDAGFEYQIHHASFRSGGRIFHTSKVIWNEKPLVGSAKDIVRFAETGVTTKSMTAVDRAGRFLLEQLAGGDLTYPEIEQRAKDAGISISAIKRAKSAIGIRSEKQCGSGLANPPHIWRLSPTSKAQCASAQRLDSSVGSLCEPLAAAEYQQRRTCMPPMFNSLDSVDSVDSVDTVAPSAHVIKGTSGVLVIKGTAYVQ